VADRCEDFSLSTFKLSTSALRVEMVSVSVSISLARSAFEGSAMGTVAEVADGGEGGGLDGWCAAAAAGVVEDDSVEVERDEEDRCDRDTRLSRARSPG
jgi:hypothetical protein